MTTPNSKEKTVLVVENNPDDIYLLHLAARQECPEISFVFVHDGSEALAYLKGDGEFAGRRSRPPNLVLLDARLAPGEGYNIVQRLRQTAECESLNVLLWTDGVEPGFEAQAAQAGANLALRKPHSFTELMAEVKRICALAQA